MIINEVASLIRCAVDEVATDDLICAYPEVEKGSVYIKNEMWKCPGMRKIHLETGRAQGMDVLHCVWFPDPAYNLPIFGCDVVATKHEVTAAIVDISPVYGTDAIYEQIAPIANSYSFPHKRVLPLWSDEIFSPHCKFMRLKSLRENQDYCDVLMRYLMVYVDEIYNAEIDTEWIHEMKRLDDQIYYCKQQKKNTKTIAVLSKWFDPLWAENYIDTILFDEPK